MAAGNRAAAIRWYAHLREALQQELGVAPDRDTEALYEQCVAGLQQAGRPSSGGPWRMPRWRHGWGCRPSERPGGIVLRGPAGIGKSAFCRELGALARERGWTVVRVDAAQPGRAYAVIAALAEQIVLSDRGTLDRIGAPARSVLAQLSPLAAPAAALPGPLGRHQVIGALRRLLLAASGGSDIIVQVDDAHLIDDADVDVLMLLCSGRSARSRGAGDTSADAGFGARPRRVAPGRQRRHAGARPRAAGRRRVPSARGPGCAVSPVRRNHGAHRARGRGQPVRGDRTRALRRILRRAAAARNVAEAIIARLCDVPDAALASLKWMALAGDAFDAATAAALAPGAQSHAFAALDIAAGSRRARAGRHRLPVPARPRAPGPDRADCASSAFEDASPGSATAGRTRRRAGPRGPPLARRRRTSRRHALAAGSGARCGAAGGLQRRVAPSGACAGFRGGPCRGTAPARGGTGCDGRSGGSCSLPGSRRVPPTSRCPTTCARKARWRRSSRATRRARCWHWWAFGRPASMGCCARP